MEDKKDLSEQEIEALRGKEKQEREEKCTQEIETALAKYNCVLDVELVMTLQGYKFNIKVVAKE